MIEINLLPEELKKQQAKKEPRQIKVSELPIKLIIAVSITVFIFIQILSAMVFVIKSNSLNGLNKRFGQLESDYKVAQALKLQMRQLNNKLTAINELTSKSIMWSKKMYDLSKATSDGVWLSELKLLAEKGAKKQQAMLLEGSVVSHPRGEEAALIGAFINSLKSNKDFFDDFEEIKLESSQMRKIAGLDVMDFKIICFFKKGKIYFD